MYHSYECDANLIRSSRKTIVLQEPWPGYGYGYGETSDRIDGDSRH